MVRRPWQDLDAQGPFCHWGQNLDERMLHAMGIPILSLAIAFLVLGLERNARRARRQLPIVLGGTAPHERRDRDTERLLDELRSQA
jgi:hypothetical protein